MGKSGQFGSALSMVDAMKFGMLGAVGAISTWITAYTLGNTVDELIGWFDEWSDNASSEGSDNDTNKVDPNGTSIGEDFFYHATTVVYSWFVFTSIMVGGDYFVS